jgi:hypothetical protein
VPQSSNSWGLNEATAEKQLTSILGKYGLNINSSKTKFMKIDKNSQSFAFLGYDICVNNHNVSLQISSERINRYKKRIKSSFDVHHSKTGHNQAADALLLNRIRFLSANTRLRGSKRNVFAGIYFSNPDVSSIDHLRALTLFTNHEISKIENPTLAKRLRGLDFGANYTNKKIFLFTDETLKAIPKAWSNEE